MTRMKKKSYGNIHSLKDRAYHEVTQSPTSSPTMQRRSLAVPPTFPLRALMARCVQSVIKSSRSLYWAYAEHNNWLY